MSFWDDVQDWWNGLSDRWNSPHDDPWDAVLDVMDIDDASRKRAISMLSGVPIVGDIWKAMDQYKQTEDYMDNRGIDWTDVKYPALVNTGSNYAYNVINRGTSFVSDNVKSLYDGDRKKRRK